MRQHSVVLCHLIIGVVTFIQNVQVGPHCVLKHTHEFVHIDNRVLILHELPHTQRCLVSQLFVLLEQTTRFLVVVESLTTHLWAVREGKSSSS